jgi:N-acetylmuramic acid 6-phosphate (MurNAc-6-P) etherase
MAGALTVLISESPPERDDFFDIHIPLRSGAEVVAGSTRMKAGTATKKILNMLSTSTMTLLGKIEDCHMIDVACVNEKLVNRAVGILNALYGWDRSKAERELEKHHYRLIEIVEERRRAGK